jgi:hypothetical protein
MIDAPDCRGTVPLTQADHAELWCLFACLWDEYAAHLPCSDCALGECDRAKRAVAVYCDYHLRLVRLRNAQTLRAIENGNNLCAPR